MPRKLEDLDFQYRNTPVKVVANKNLPEIKLAGISIGPLQEGNEYQVYFWIADELAQAGIVHFREEDVLEATALFKIQFKERVQVAGQISDLPLDFYPKLRRYLNNTKQDIPSHPEKHQEHEKAKQLAGDIINSRLKKIVTLSTGPQQSDQLLKKLTTEEKLIYQQLNNAVTHWRTSILKQETKR